MEETLLLEKEVVVLLRVSPLGWGCLFADEQQGGLVGERVDGHGGDEVDPRRVIAKHIHADERGSVLPAALDEVVHGVRYDEEMATRGEKEPQ